MKSIFNRTGQAKEVLRKKLRSSKAFTLSEMLAATMIILLVSAGMVSTISLAARQFDSSIRQSEANILCSSLKTLIMDEMSYTTEIHVDALDETTHSGNVVAYQSQNYAQEECLAAWTTNNGGNYGLISVGNADDLEEQMIILGKGAYARNVAAKVSSITYSNDTHLFTITLSIAYKNEEILKEVFEVRNVNLTTATVQH